MPDRPLLDPFSRMRRPIFITGWIIIAFVGSIALTLGGLRAMDRLDPTLLQSVFGTVPAEVFLQVVVIVGPLVVIHCRGILWASGQAAGHSQARARSSTSVRVPGAPHGTL